ncbi:MAG: Acyl-CoA dehydrogenase, short-chain specific [uncultured Thermoleophilia bacterium]|uniref:Acyl-CoA dehydrogenase, short-chain specific n=1 Tax=uncultured Thermoleophilia bacterium TaxID=1497501 RepID=A0A6J4U2A7_9ACTN|nr:MAG: Acyl-CoA dehydrogenase, short-chain specific [uncultured Thermoleophilia bacterium]
MAAVAEETKNGLDPMFDPVWFLNEEQIGLLARLREICETEIRPRARHNDATLTFPRESLEALGPDGFLGVMLPKEWGGLGQNHVFYAWVTETIARYGDASCAMCYVMHTGAVETLRLRQTDYFVENYLKKVKDGLIGTLSYSDPETGSHFWYPMASGARRVEGGFEVLKKASWTTSGGFADFYVCQTTSPDYGGDYSNLSVFLIDASQIQAEPQEWDALGLRGNQSGSLLVDWGFVPEQQLVGPIGDGAASNDESVDPNFLIGSSGVWSGIALGAIDIAISHTTRKTHKDVGLRVCDYPTIQDAVGEAIIETNSARAFTFSVAQALDKVTDDARRNPPVGELARADYLPFLWQIKFRAAKNVARVVDKMLHCTGGTGYKKKPLDIERYLRDGKAGWVMGPTNEVLRQFVGKTALLGYDSLDYWNQVVNTRAMENEIKKLGPEEKRKLAERLLGEADGSSNGGSPA